MYKSFRSKIISTLIAALIMVPLYGVMAMTNASLSAVVIDSNNKQAESLNSQQSPQFKPSCEHCKKNNCHEKHKCNNGQCATTTVILLSSSIICDIKLTDPKPYIYTVGLVIPPLSSLYRPPK